MTKREDAGEDMPSKVQAKRMPPNAGKGRPKGTPNKATHAAREAIAAFVDGNAHRLEGWLTAIAQGDPVAEIKPNPIKAFELFQSVIEYHVPKLARTEHTGDGGGAVQMSLAVSFTKPAAKTEGKEGDK